ncbi:hypothetical protein jhhlp_002160 [Lomentospora prolificans]|uniref:NACHT domain-containing protein n=1 Tax=Lomentospora prolificans TaxID=41688 RepID=A0A2N3NDB0_9PEZI|nr:hypothetical protein jhhlp_002160 [Lomentospora prolificans]
MDSHEAKRRLSRLKGKLKSTFKFQNPSQSPPVVGSSVASISEIQETSSTHESDNPTPAISLIPSETSTPMPSSKQKDCHASLQLVSPPENENGADVDIIAIPGLDTESPDTWIWKSQPSDPTADASAVNWLTDPSMLPALVGSARIFTCDWPSSLFIPQDTIERTVQELARVLLLSIQARRFKDLDRPILFIASCLGGVILIQALVLAAKENSDYESLWKATKGIVFLATPFRGTAFQNLAAVAVPFMDCYAALKGQAVPRPLLDSVRESTYSLEELIRDFTREYQHGGRTCQLAVFYEMRKTNLLSKGLPRCVADLLKGPELLVDRTSACLDVVPDPIGLDRAHVLMNKFSSTEDLDYCRVSDKIRLMLQTIRTPSILKDTDDWIRNRHYTKARLKIERISGEYLPIDQCYINLVLVEHTSGVSNSTEDENNGPQSSPFSLTSRLKIEKLDATQTIALPALFDPRKVHGLKVNPRRVLIHGRAGVGKTTLCKKIVLDFLEKRMWSNLYDRVLWVPLRNLRGRKASGYNLEELFYDEYFSQRPNGRKFAKELFERIVKSTGNRTLFLLDGLDEATDLNDMDTFLGYLLSQPNYIVTARPHAKYSKLFRSSEKPDLELETIGFQPEQVNDYLKTTISDKQKVDDMQSFLRKHLLIQGLVRIPIQLDAFCFTWDEGFGVTDVPETMTAVYRAIESKLWRKDILRLQEGIGDRPMKEDSVREATASEVKRLIAAETELLEAFGFAGLYCNIIEFHSSHQDVVEEEVNYTRSGRFLGETLSRLSFLRTSDTSRNRSQRSYHFLHLTFQEYFAARYFVRQWKIRKPLQCLDLHQGNHKNIPPADFLQKHKYNPRYDIFWRFVSGLLCLEPEEQITCFFEAVEQEPLDLLGPSHQRLVMHCLNEAGPSMTKSDKFHLLQVKLEGRLFEWMYFECICSDETYLAREAEFPEKMLEKALKECSQRQRSSILNAIRQRPYLSEIAVNALLALLIDIESHVREAAAKALGNQSSLSEMAVNALLALLIDTDIESHVRYAAADTLGNQSSLSEMAVNALIDTESHVREAAANALGNQSSLSEMAVNALLALLIDTDIESHVQYAAAEVLGNQSSLSEMAVNALLALLIDIESHVRYIAAYTLGNQSSLSEMAVNALLALLIDTDTESYVRYTAANALGNQSSLSEMAVNALLALLIDTDIESHVRQVAAYALGNQSSLSEMAVNALLALLIDTDTESHVQYTAANALGNQSSLSEMAVNALLALLIDTDTESHVRDVAAYTLGNQSSLSEMAVNALLALLIDTDIESHVRYIAANALGNQSSLSEMAVNALLALLIDTDTDWHVRQAAAEVLGNQSARVVQQISTEPAILSFYSDELIGGLYLGLLLRSFRTSLSWFILPGQDCSLLYQQDEVNKLQFGDQIKDGRLLHIIDTVREGLAGGDSHKLWHKALETSPIQH